jgi:hypothetical protein
MNESFKKILAREVLIFFGMIGLTVIVALGIWCYSLIVDKMIDSKGNRIKTLYTNELNLSRSYDDKFSKVKSIITSIYLINNSTSNSQITLSNDQLSEVKAIKLHYWRLKSGQIDKNEYDRIMKISSNKFQKIIIERQKMLGGLPEHNDSVSYNECINRLTGLGARIDKDLVPDTTFAESEPIFIPDLPEDSILSYGILAIWNCLVTHKEHLALMLPYSVRNDYNINSRQDLYDLIAQVKITEEELKNKSIANAIHKQINQLKFEKFKLSQKVLTAKDLILNVKLTFLVLLIIGYPLRLIYVTLSWAIKIYRQKAE